METLVFRSWNQCITLGVKIGVTSDVMVKSVKKYCIDIGVLRQNIKFSEMDIEFEFRVEFFVVDLKMYGQVQEKLRSTLPFRDWEWVKKTVDALELSLVRPSVHEIGQYVAMKGMDSYFGTNNSYENYRRSRFDSIRQGCASDKLNSELIYSFAMEYANSNCLEFYHTSWNYAEGIQLPKKMLKYLCPDIQESFGNPEDYFYKWNEGHPAERIAVECLLNEIMPKDKLFEEICLFNDPIYALPPRLERSVIERFIQMKNEKLVDAETIRMYDDLIFRNLTGSKKLCAVVE